MVTVWYWNFTEYSETYKQFYEVLLTLRLLTALHSAHMPFQDIQLFIIPRKIYPFHCVSIAHVYPYLWYALLQWKEVDSGQLMDSKLKCVFVMPENGSAESADGRQSGEIVKSGKAPPTGIIMRHALSSTRFTLLCHNYSYCPLIRREICVI